MASFITDFQATIAKLLTKDAEKAKRIDALEATVAELKAAIAKLQKAK